MMTDRELMQQALDAMLNNPDDISDEMFEAIKALKERLAQAKQEPVAYMYPGDFEWLQKTQTHAEVMTKEFANLEICIPLYAAPRQWQGLTDEEIYLNTNNIDRGERGWAVKFARAIEAKLKEKNNGQ